MSWAQGAGVQIAGPTVSVKPQGPPEATTAGALAEFESIADPQETLRNLERKSCKTVFLGSHSFSTDRLSPLFNGKPAGMDKYLGFGRLLLRRGAPISAQRLRRGETLRLAFWRPHYLTAREPSSDATGPYSASSQPYFGPERRLSV